MFLQEFIRESSTRLHRLLLSQIMAQVYDDYDFEVPSKVGVVNNKLPKIRSLHTTTNTLNLAFRPAHTIHYSNCLDALKDAPVLDRAHG